MAEDEPGVQRVPALLSGRKRPRCRLYDSNLYQMSIATTLSRQGPKRGAYKLPGNMTGSAEIVLLQTVFTGSWLNDRF